MAAHPWRVEVHLVIAIDGELTPEQAVIVAVDRCQLIRDAKLYSHSDPHYLYREEVTERLPGGREWVESARRYIVDEECDCDCLLCIRGEHHDGCGASLVRT